jgi:hypothetical protein
LGVKDESIIATLASEGLVVVEVVASHAVVVAPAALAYLGCLVEPLACRTERALFEFPVVDHVGRAEGPAELGR